MIVYHYQAKLLDTMLDLHIVVSNAKLLALDWFDNQKTLQNLTKKAEKLEKIDSLEQKNQLYQQNCEVLFLVKAQLDEYFAGKRQSFELPLDLSFGTPFQQKVWHALSQIGYGETISYATLAKRIGQEKAYRTVANANAKNPISIVIPCHRVIASDGGLGGYSGGVAIKENLLRLEGIYRNCEVFEKPIDVVIAQQK